MKVWPFVAAAAVVGLAAWRFRRLSNLQRAGAVVLVAGLCVYGSGLIELPNLEELITDIGRTLGKWTYLLVGLLTFLETGAFVGLIAPGETAIILGGVVAGQGEISLAVLIGIVWACAVAGDTVSFLLGRKLGRGFLERHGPKVKITEDRLRWVEGFFERRGGATILIGRFVGLARALAPFVAGASRMSYAKFLPYDIVGAGLWGTTFCILGYVFWRSFSQLVEIAKQGAFALGTVIVLVVGAIWAFRFLRVAENRRRAAEWIERQSDKPVLRPAARVARPLYRRALQPAWHRLQGPLRFGWERFTPGGLGLEMTTLVAVASVGGATYASMVVLLGDEGFLALDADALDAADSIRSGVLVDAAKVFDVVGTAPVVGAVILAVTGWLVLRRAPLAAATLLASSLITWAGIGIARRTEDRPRPVESLVDAGGSSFPANHAAYAVAYVAIAVLVARVVPHWAGRAGLVVAAIVLAVAIGLADVYLRANYLSDVLAGWGLAAAIFALCGAVSLVVTHLRQNGRLA